MHVGGGSKHINLLSHSMSNANHSLVTRKSPKNTVATKMSATYELTLWKLVIFLVTLNFRSKQFDVIHLHGRMAGILGRVLCPSYRSRIIYTLHGFDFAREHSYRKYIFLFLEYLLYPLTRRFIFVSEQEQSNYLKFVKIARRAKCRIVYNFSNNDVPQKTSVITKPGRVKLLYIGRLTSQKGIDILIDAYCRLSIPNCSLDVIGDGPLKPILVEKLNRHEHRTSITFTGEITTASNYLRHYDGIIIPSRFEGMPYILIEAIEAGIPIICTLCTGIDEFMTSENAFVCEPNSAHSLALTISEFVQQNATVTGIENISQRVDCAKGLLKNQFNKDVQISALRDIYTNLTMLK